MKPIASPILSLCLIGCLGATNVAAEVVVDPLVPNVDPSLPDVPPVLRLADLIKLRPDAYAITQDQINLAQAKLKIRVKPGYQLVFVYDEPSNKAYYVDHAALLTPLIMLVSKDTVLGILPEDPDKELGDETDCIEQGDKVDFP